MQKNVASRTRIEDGWHDGANWCVGETAGGDAQRLSVQSEQVGYSGVCPWWCKVWDMCPVLFAGEKTSQHVLLLSPLVSGWQWRPFYSIFAQSVRVFLNFSVIFVVITYCGDFLACLRPSHVFFLPSGGFCDFPFFLFSIFSEEIV